MTKAELMKDVGNYVELRLFDGTELKGKLGYTTEFCEEQGYRKPNYFYIDDYCFKISHVKKLHFRKIFKVEITTNEEYATILKNCAFMLKDGIKYMKEEHQKQFKEAYEKAIEVLSIEPEGWISIENGRPKESGSYWVTIQNTINVRWVCTDEYHAERDFFETERKWNASEIKIVAWQPVTKPSPYEGDKE